MTPQLGTMAAAASSSSSSLEKEERYRKALVSFARGQLEKERAMMSASEIEKERIEMEKQRRRSTKAANLSEYREIIQRSRKPIQHKPWEPKDIKIDLKEESELMKAMQYTIEEVDISDFYSKFLRQIQSLQFLNHFSRVLGSESKFQVVIYGGGFSAFSFHESVRIKLALMLLIKRDFNDRIGQIQIFDSGLTKSAVRVLEDLGFTVLRVNENAYREVLKPTLFFLPHANPEVLDHVLRANWKPENLNRMILLGNDLNGTKDTMVQLNEFRVTKFKINGKYLRMYRYLMCIPRFTTAIPLSSIDGDELSQKFLSHTSQMNWYFFTWFDDDPKMKLLLKPVVVITGIFYYLFYKYRKCKLLHKEETCSSKRNYSIFFRLGWLLRRQRIRSHKHPQKVILLEEKKKRRKMFYVSRAVVVPWFEGLPRKKWAGARKIAQEVMNLMKKNDDEISYQQLDELFETWF